MTAPDRDALAALTERVRTCADDLNTQDEATVRDELFLIASKMQALATPAAVTGDGEDYETRVDGERVRKDRWELGFRNIVTAMVGARTEFEIPDIVQRVREMVAASEGVQGCDCAASVDGDADQRRHSADCAVYDRHTKEDVQGGEAVVARLPVVDGKAIERAVMADTSRPCLYGVSGPCSHPNCLESHFKTLYDAAPTPPALPVVDEAEFAKLVLGFMQRHASTTILWKDMADLYLSRLAALRNDEQGDKS